VYPGPVILLLSENPYEESGAATYVSSAVTCDGVSVGSVEVDAVNNTRSSSTSMAATGAEISDRR
jgi:hypothetical protein